MWALNWILHEPIWKRCHLFFRFRTNINEPLRLMYIECFLLWQVHRELVRLIIIFLQDPQLKFRERDILYL